MGGSKYLIWLIVGLTCPGLAWSETKAIFHPNLESINVADEWIIDGSGE